VHAKPILEDQGGCVPTLVEKTGGASIFER
jgi:hypothetical protein